eukprot:m.14962 g.14962  ORF g.14962 m.14962 type:complete len:191 (-) comp7791_c0_seq2:682-1254(-)
MEKKNKERKRKQMMRVVGVMAGFVSVGAGLLWPFIRPALRKSPPFIPTTCFHINNITKVVKQQHCRKFVDLGSGDGRVVINVAKCANVSLAAGVELNPWLVMYSRVKAFREGVRATTSFAVADIWKKNYSEFDSVVVFGAREMMDGLYAKLNNELHPGSLIMSCQFPFAGVTPWDLFENGDQKLYVYRVS